ncbi:hypothetical protein D9756_007163 [Leucocoprinus leucothites]|uniref:Uncharacterized protein n=1 Tax=Leucocoprinus leucothites TaxID=201217 RepID=A0A8H5FYS6_9AGAR|nr:hypothetical protein D9756_007163 [Leucoagaricus leucothites]
MASIAFLFFCIAAFTLVKNLKGYPKWILLASAVVMFSISTVDASITTRIWWMARQARKILGPTLARRYYSAMVIISDRIESGAIYSLYVLADEVVKTMQV